MNLVCRLLLEKNFFLMIRRPPRSTRKESSAASDVYKRQVIEERDIEKNYLLEDKEQDVMQEQEKVKQSQILVKN